MSSFVWVCTTYPEQYGPEVVNMNNSWWKRCFIHSFMPSVLLFWPPGCQQHHWQNVTELLTTNPVKNINICQICVYWKHLQNLPGHVTILQVYVEHKYISPVQPKRTYPALKLTWKIGFPKQKLKTSSNHPFSGLKLSGIFDPFRAPPKVKDNRPHQPQLPEDLWDSQMENKPHTNQLTIIEPTIPQWFRDTFEVRKCQANPFVETTSSFLTRALSQRCEIKVFLVRKRLMISVEAFHYMSSMPHVSIHRKITITKSV